MTIRQRVVAELLASPRPLQVHRLARRLRLTIVQTSNALQSLRIAGDAKCDNRLHWSAVRETGRRAPNAEAVLDVLATAGGPLTTTEIGERAGLTQRQAEAAVRRLETMRLAQADNEQMRGRSLLWRPTRFVR